MSLQDLQMFEFKYLIYIFYAQNLQLIILELISYIIHSIHIINLYSKVVLFKLLDCYLMIIVIIIIIVQHFHYYQDLTFMLSFIIFLIFKYSFIQLIVDLLQLFSFLLIINFIRINLIQMYMQQLIIQKLKLLPWMNHPLKKLFSLHHYQ